MLRGFLFAFVALAVSSPAAAVDVRLVELTQGNDADHAEALRNAVFDRDSHSRVFSRIELHGVTSEANYVPAGSTFKWRYYQDRVEGGGTPNGLLGEFSVRYLGPVGNCPWQWSDGSCGLLLKIWSSISRCIPEGRYRVEALLDDALLGEKVFYPSRFRPIIEAITVEGNPATPWLPAVRGHAKVDATPVTSEVRIRGVAGPEGACTTTDMNWMPGTVVRVGNTIQPGSGGHRQFTAATEIGTGKYSAERPGDVLNPLTASSRDTVIEGLVDRETGSYRATYLPGEFGVTEKITYQARRAATDRFAAVVSPKRSVTVDIRVPGLVEMTSGPAESDGFHLQPGEGCARDPAARHVSADFLSLLGELDRSYRRRFGHRLSFGGASLPFGGAIDGGSIEGGDGGGTSRCRGVHDRGLDIDIGALDEGGEDIRATIYRLNGVAVPRLFYLASTARKMNNALQNIPEGNVIHLQLGSVHDE